MQRCQYHKRKNAESYLPKREQARIRGKMEAAYKEPTHKEAENALNTLKPTLELINQSAASQSGRIEKHSSSRFGLPISCTAKDYFRNIIPCNGKSSLLSEEVRQQRCKGNG